ARRCRDEALELVDDLATSHEAVGMLGDLILPHQALDEQHRIAEPARHADRVCRERLGGLELSGGIPHARCELCQDGGTERRAPAAESGTRLLEEREGALVVGVARDGPPHAVAQGRPREQLRVTELERQVAGLEERAAGARIAGGLLRPGEAEQQVTAAASFAAGYERERALVVASAFVESVALHRADAAAGR